MMIRKHMKRHERPYGCTFLACNKTFGSKNDWKRHENSQHFHLETWRCDKEKPEGGACAKVSYRRQTFQEHLKKEHDIIDQAAVQNICTSVLEVGWSFMNTSHVPPPRFQVARINSGCDLVSILSCVVSHRVRSRLAMTVSP